MDYIKYKYIEYIIELKFYFNKDVSKQRKG